MESATIDEGSAMGLGFGRDSDRGSSASTPIDSSNIGYQMLKKHGWKEGTGLGISEQGRLEPLKSYHKQNKRGLGADKPKEIGKSTTPDRQEPKIKISFFLQYLFTGPGPSTFSTIFPKYYDDGRLGQVVEGGGKRRVFSIGNYLPKRKAKGMSKKMKKIQEHEERLKEKEFDRDFFREFWPDNV